MIPDASNAAKSASALDESVLDALGQPQGKWRSDFVNRVIIIFLETAMARWEISKKGQRPVTTPHCTKPRMR
jgi:hypothetical protein